MFYSCRIYIVKILIRNEAEKRTAAVSLALHLFVSAPVREGLVRCGSACFWPMLVFFGDFGAFWFCRLIFLVLFVDVWVWGR